MQLYDLSNDISESKNVQADHRDGVDRLTKLLDQIIANGRSTPGVPQKNDARIEVNKSNEKAAGE